MRRENALQFAGGCGIFQRSRYWTAVYARFQVEMFYRVALPPYDPLPVIDQSTARPLAPGGASPQENEPFNDDEESRAPEGSGSIRVPPQGSRPLRSEMPDSHSGSAGEGTGRFLIQCLF